MAIFFVGGIRVFEVALECPYRDLFIYLLNGAVEEDEEALLGDDLVGNWIEEGMSVLFFSSPARLDDLLASRPDLSVSDEHYFTYEEWQGGGFDGVETGDFAISSPWRDHPASAGPLRRMIIDPGVVFGNGLHPTTRDCLDGLCWLWRAFGVKRVLDLGTGTGILGIGAALLGAESVFAVDLNRLCVRTARRNAALNRVESIMRVECGDALSYTGFDSDLIMANLHFPVIRELLLERRWNRGEIVLISGLFRSDSAECTDILKKRGFSILRVSDEDMTWYTIAARIRER